MRKAFQFIPFEDVVTPVIDQVSATIPDQALSLREMMMRFAYIGTDRLEELVNRGFYGDEDDPDIIGVDAGALDFAEVHDRYIELIEKERDARALHNIVGSVEPPPSSQGTDVSPTMPAVEAPATE